MMYFLTQNDGLFTLNQCSIYDFIDEFSEKTTTPRGVGNKYYFDEQAQEIHVWHSGKSMRTNIGKITKEEANKLLAKWAIEFQDMMFANSNLEKLLEQITHYYQENTDDFAEASKPSELEIITSLEAVIQEIKRKM